jgi:hypothetical protein
LSIKNCPAEAKTVVKKERTKKRVARVILPRQGINIISGRKQADNRWKVWGDHLCDTGCGTMSDDTGKSKSKYNYSKFLFKSQYIDKLAIFSRTIPSLTYQRQMNFILIQKNLHICIFTYFLLILLY